MVTMMHKELETLIIPPDVMNDIDRAAAGEGLDSLGLMERAGRAVGAAALRRYPGALRFVVLCGPGNNGGDGYVAARHLREAGAPPAVHALGDPAMLTGDAAAMATAFGGPILPLSDFAPRPGDVVIDALFGAGLSRDVPADVIAIIGRVRDLALPVLAVDLPSGVDGRTGGICGAAFQAEATVTFVCRKPGHLLLPGRMLSGTVELFDIGIPARTVLRHSSHLRVNSPSIWRSALTPAGAGSHKYTRGHLAVFSGPFTATGAARLAAAAGLRAGAGLVTVLAAGPALAANAAHLTAVMLRRIDDGEGLSALLEDRRVTIFVLGPGFGDGERARDYAARIAAAGRRLVLDADGISAFRDAPDRLFSLFSGQVRLVLTPHDGEFERLFPDLAANRTFSRIDRALQAAARSNAVVILKGADTVIAVPDGRALVNVNAPPFLATAGSGDVLSGIVGAHLAQGLAPFEAAASAVWRHGEAGRIAGDGLTAEDLPDAVPPWPRD